MQINPKEKIPMVCNPMNQIIHVGKFLGGLESSKIPFKVLRIKETLKVGVVVSKILPLRTFHIFQQARRIISVEKVTHN